MADEEQFNDDLEVSDEDEGTEDEEVEETEESEGPEDEKKSDDDVQKRIRDLQSKADKAEARANKAEKALATAGKSKPEGSNDPARDALMSELREASLDAIWGEYPELKKFNIDRSLVDGSTRAEMRESATSIVALIKSVSTKARNETLAEHGWKAEPAGSTRQKPVDFESMPQDQFEKYLDSL